MSYEAELIKDLMSRVDYLEDRLDLLDKKKPTKRDKGESVWVSFASAYFSKYGASPQKDSLSTAQARSLENKLGNTIAVELVKFYLEQRDNKYTQKYHALGACISDLDDLLMRLKNR